MVKPKIPSKLHEDPLYKVWTSMKQRCYNKNNKCYKQYGKSGITVCKEWIHNFNNFKNWSIENGYKKGLSIDRINSTKGYYPDNCRWIPISEQPKNRKTNVYVNYNGEIITVKEFSNKTKYTYNAIMHHFYRHGNLDRFNCKIATYVEYINQ